MQSQAAVGEVEQVRAGHGGLWPPLLCGGVSEPAPTFAHPGPLAGMAVLYLPDYVANMA